MEEDISHEDYLRLLRPPETPPRYLKALNRKVGDLFDELSFEQSVFTNTDLILDDEDLAMLTVALVEMVEDLHCNIGIWHALESYP